MRSTTNIYNGSNYTGGYDVFVGKVVRIKPKYDSRSISGRVVSISSDGLITLEDRLGRLTMIKQADVSVISEVS